MQPSPYYPASRRWTNPLYLRVERTTAYRNAPTDLRDLVWAPAHLWFVNGGDTVALVPTRYPGTAAEGDAGQQMARKTEWLPIGPEQYRGLGQRILTTSGAELGLLETRDIVFDPAPPQD